MTSGVSNIFFITKHLTDDLLMPNSSFPGSWNISPVHLIGNPCSAIPIQIGTEHPSHYLSFALFDDQILSIQHLISERSHTSDEFSPLHPSLVAHSLVFGDGDGFLLGKGTGNAHHQFSGERSGVNVLFFKLDGYTQAEQLPEGGQAVAGVAGEAGDGFDQYLIDF